MLNTSFYFKYVQYTAGLNEKTGNLRGWYQIPYLWHLLKVKTPSKYVPNSINVKVSLMFN